MVTCLVVNQVILVDQLLCSDELLKAKMIVNNNHQFIMKFTSWFHIGT
jgi:hypothetical protein